MMVTLLARVVMLVLWVGVETPVFGQAPELDLPEDAGTKEGRRPATPPAPGKPAATPGGPAEAPHEAPVEASQAPVKPPPPGERLKQIKERLLDLQATDSGTSATKFIPRIQLSTEIRKRPNGSQEERSVLRVDRPIGERGLLRVDVRYQERNSADSDTTSTKGGLGDLFVRLGYRLLDREGFHLFVGSDVIFPTADPDVLGRGKYQIGPGVAASFALPQINSSLFPLVQHIQSVGGDPSRRNVDYSSLTLRLNTPWSPQWWTFVQSELRLDWTRDRKTGMFLTGEIGRRLGPNYRLYGRVGGAAWGANVTGGYDYLGQIGVRYMF